METRQSTANSCSYIEKYKRFCSSTEAGIVLKFLNKNEPRVVLKKVYYISHWCCQKFWLEGAQIGKNC